MGNVAAISKSRTLKREMDFAATIAGLQDGDLLFSYFLSYTHRVLATCFPISPRLYWSYIIVSKNPILYEYD